MRPQSHPRVTLSHSELPRVTQSRPELPRVTSRAVQSRPELLRGTSKQNGNGLTDERAYPLIEMRGRIYEVLLYA